MSRKAFLTLKKLIKTNHDVQAGIFDPEHDRVWHDAGQETFVVYATKQGMNIWSIAGWLYNRKIFKLKIFTIMLII